jgi:hypothetical protein
MRTSAIAVTVIFWIVGSIVPVSAMGPRVASPIDTGNSAVGEAPGSGLTVTVVLSFSESGDAPIGGPSDDVICQTGGSASLGPLRGGGLEPVAI